MALATLICLLAAGVAARADSRRSVGAADFTPVLTPAPGQTKVHVAGFRLDARPITNGQFVEFVRSHPQWRRDRVPGLFADESYLSQWAAPADLGAQVRRDQPVTRVSWFAARAYCAAAGGRLPAWNEWELAAAADERVADARANTVWRARILDWYARPATDPLNPVGLGRPNLYGIHDLHGLIWEWVDDYSSLMVSNDSRNQGDPDKLEFCGAGSISAQDRENYPVLMRVAFLSALEGRSTGRRLGFRCADGGGAPAAAGIARITADVTRVRDAEATGDRRSFVDAAEPIPGNSLYQLAISLQTADGGTIPLSSFRGQPLIVTMFYGHCTNVCPMLVNQLQNLQQRLGSKTRANTRILMVSFDSANDAPAELSAFRHQHRIDDSRLILARTSADSVRLLAVVLGIRYRQLPDKSFNHSTVITLVDQEGVIRARTSGIRSSEAELVAAANSMLTGRAAIQPAGGSQRPQ